LRRSLEFYGAHAQISAFLSQPSIYRRAPSFAPWRSKIQLSSVSEFAGWLPRLRAECYPCDEFQAPAGAAKTKRSNATTGVEREQADGRTSMKTTFLITGLAAAALAASASAQEMDFNKVEIITQQLGPNVYMLTGSSGLDPSHEDAAGGRVGVLA
jgi:hypothetical protein